MKKRIVSIVIALVMFAGTFAQQETIKIESKEKNGAYTITDTSEGIINDAVTAKKLEITDENAEVLEDSKYFSDLIFVSTPLSDAKVKIDIIGVKGLMKSFEMKNNAAWLKDIRNSVVRFDTYAHRDSDYRVSAENDVLYLVQNPDTNKWDLLNATTGKFYDYEASSEKKYTPIFGKEEDLKAEKISCELLGIEVEVDVKDGDSYTYNMLYLSNNGEKVLELDNTLIMSGGNVWATFEKYGTYLVGDSKNDSSRASSTYLISKEEGVIKELKDTYFYTGKFQDRYAIFSSGVDVNDGEYLDAKTGEIKSTGLNKSDGLNGELHRMYLGTEDGSYWSYSSTYNAAEEYYFVKDTDKKRLDNDAMNITSTYTGEEVFVIEEKTYQDDDLTKEIGHIYRNGEEISNYSTKSARGSKVQVDGENSWLYKNQFIWSDGDYVLFEDLYCDENGSNKEYTRRLVNAEGETLYTYNIENKSAKDNDYQLYNDRFFVSYNKHDGGVYDIKTETFWKGSLQSGHMYNDNSPDIMEIGGCSYGVLYMDGESCLINFDTGKTYKPEEDTLYRVKGWAEDSTNSETALIYVDFYGDKPLVLNQNFEVVLEDVFWLNSKGMIYKNDGVYNEQGEKIKNYYTDSLYSSSSYSSFLQNALVYNNDEIMRIATEKDAEYGEDSCYTWCDVNGELIVSEKYQQISQFYQDMAYARDGNKAVVLNYNGEKLIEKECKKDRFRWYFDGTGKDEFESNNVMSGVGLILQDDDNTFYLYDFSDAHTDGYNPKTVDYSTSTSGVCAASSIAALLGNSDYSSYVGSIRSIAMIIPGLKQTNMGNNTACYNMVPQGVCTTNDYVLISAFCEDEKHNSVIYVMNKDTKKYITTILLSVEDNAGLKDKNGNHVGGLAFGNNTVYIAGSKDKKVWKLPYGDVLDAVSSGKDAYTVTIPKDYYISTNKASFVYWDDSYKELFVGSYNESDASKNFMYSYNVDTGKASSGKIQLPQQTQGVSFGIGVDNKTYCICSKSWRRTNQSEMYVAELKKEKDTSSYVLTNWYKITTPNMSEDIQVWGGTLYNCFESAANNYNGGGKKEQPFDRIPYIGVRALISSVMKEGKTSSIKKAAVDSEDEIDDNSGIILEGSCGENVSYCLYDDGELLVSGQGSMEDYSEDMTPWSDYENDITSVYVDRGVTGIGEYAFYNCPNLTEITLSEYMNSDASFTIGYNAFGNCSMVEKVTLPDISIDIKSKAFDESASIQFNSDSDDIEEYTTDNDNIVLHQHNFEYVETVKATCMTSGYDLYQCECGFEEVTNIVEATAEHSYKEVERSEATEVDEGFIKYQCENCIDTYTETLEYVQPADIPKATEKPSSVKTSSSAAKFSKTKKRVTVKKPGKVSGLAVKNKKNKKIILSWSWKKNVSGFQIQYAQNKKFTKKKKSKIVGKWSSKKTITKLKKGKKYYVRVRAYRKSSGKKIYGKWSKIKKIKIRK